MAVSPATLARLFRPIGRDFYGRGWVLGTSGNFSAVVSRDPLRLAITSSGVSKADLGPKDVLFIGPDGLAVGKGNGRPSAEALLHVMLARTRGAGAVLHTHSIWSTLVSERHASDGGLDLTGFEMLKGLEGVGTHQHRERIPILDNDQDIGRLARLVETTLKSAPGAHAFLLRRHGLYTWGADLAQARRHIEILEFLLEVTGRSNGGSSAGL